MFAISDTLFEHYLDKYKEIELDENIEILRGRRLPKILESECKKEIKEVNVILSQKVLNQNLNLTQLHKLTYCGAKTVIKLAVNRGIPVYYTNIPDCFPTNSKEQEILYKTSPLQFQNLLLLEKEKKVSIEEEKLIEFWSSFWKNREFNAEPKRNKYLQKEKQRVKEKEKMKDDEITMNELNAALKSQKNWSVPGIDGLQIFWFKKFSSLRIPLLTCINKILSGNETLPKFCSVGLTELIPKNNKNEEAVSNFRPMTRLPTIYKIISKCVFQKIFQHFEKNDILPIEQTGDRKGCFGARKALIIDSIALKQEKVFCYYTDFRKAFDTVSHDWLLTLLQIYKVGNTIINNFVKPLLENMKVRLHFEDKVTGTIFLERGIFQGDPISVLFFWTVLTPLSFILKKRETLGLALKNGGFITHLLYLDDLKIYSSNSENLEKLFEKVKTYVKAVNMELNLNKTRKFQVPSNIQDVKEEKKYLGYVANPYVCHQKMIQAKFEAFEKKSLKIHHTTLKEEDKIFLKRKYVFSGIFHTFGFLNWSLDRTKLWRIGEDPDWQSKKYSSSGLDKELEKQTNGKRMFHINKKDKLIELKLICDVIKIRTQFFKEKEKWDFIRNVMLSDEHSILMLSQ